MHIRIIYIYIYICHYVVCYYLVIIRVTRYYRQIIYDKHRKFVTSQIKKMMILVLT